MSISSVCSKDSLYSPYSVHTNIENSNKFAFSSTAKTDTVHISKEAKAYFQKSQTEKKEEKMFIQPQNPLLTGVLTSQSGRVNSSVSNENSFGAVLQNANDDIDKNKKDIDRDIALIKEVGFYEYQIIIKTVNQIEAALEKALEEAKDDFPAYYKDLEGIKDLFADKLPTSVSEAMSRLNEELDNLNVPDEIKESFKEKVMRYLEEEMKKDETLDEAEREILDETKTAFF